MAQDQGISEQQLAEMEAAGHLVPVNQTPTVNPAVRSTYGAPPAAQQQPGNFSGTLPTNLQLSPDIERTQYGPSTPTFRLMPVGPGGQPTVVSAAASTAQKVIDSQSSGTASSLQMPTDVFVVSGGRPLTDTGQPEIVKLKSQNPSLFFASPAISLVPQVDVVANAGGITNNISVPSTAPTAAVDFGVLVTVGVDNSDSYQQGSVPTGWTHSFNPLTPEIEVYTILTSNAVSPISFDTFSGWSASLSLFKSTGTSGITQSTGGGGSSGSDSLTFSSTVAGGDAVILCLSAASTGGGPAPSFSAISDSEGNSYALISTNTQFITAFSQYLVTAQYAAFNVTGGSSFTVNFTVTNSASFGCWIGEINGLMNTSTGGIPVFRAIQSTDLANAIFGASGQNHSAGAVPDPGAIAGTTRYLREDATWATAVQTLQNNGTNNSSQSKLNLVAGTNVTLTDTGSGAIKIDSSGGSTASVLVKTGNYTAQSTDAGALIVMNTNPAGTWTLQSNFNNASGTSVAFTSNCSASSLLLFATAGFNNGQTGTVTDTLGNTYAQIGTFQSRGDGYGGTLWYCINAHGAGANTVSVSGFSGSFQGAYCFEFVGGATSGILDNSNQAFGTSTSPQVSVTTAQTNDMVLGWFVVNANITALNSGFSSQPPVASTPNQVLIYGQQSSIGTFTPGGTQSNNLWSAIGASFKIGGSPQNLTLKLPASLPASTWFINASCLGSGTLEIDPNGQHLDLSATPITGITAFQGMYIGTDGSTGYYSQRGGA